MGHRGPFGHSQRVPENLTQNEQNSLMFIPDYTWVLGLERLNTPEHNLPSQNLTLPPQNSLACQKRLMLLLLGFQDLPECQAVSLPRHR